MKGKDNFDQVEAHNQLQRAYYGERIKPSMKPARTPYVLRQVDEVIRFGRLRPGERVLDVGCGMGRHAFLLAERGFQVEGLELSPFLVERLQAFDGGRYGIPVYCADIHHAPEPLHGRFDAVVGFFVLHHLADLRRAFASIACLLKPNGRAVFLEPNPYNPLYYIQILVTPGMWWSAERGLLNMRAPVVFEAMQAAGLSRLALARYGFLPPFLSNTAWGRRAERALEQVTLWRPLLPFQLFRGERV